MYSLGHIALGYIFGKISSKVLETELNIPVLWTITVLPDIDILIPGLPHRGPTHSLFVAMILFIPAIVIAGMRAIPYAVSFITHSVLGDTLTGGCALLWPFSWRFVRFTRIRSLEVGTVSESYIELALFLILLSILMYSKDGSHFFRGTLQNGLLIIPIVSTFIPLIYKYPIPAPKMLNIPSVVLLVFLTSSFVFSTAKWIQQKHGPISLGKLPANPRF